MTPDGKIPTEIIQRLTPWQAWEYRLVPYAEEDGKLLCYGGDVADMEQVRVEAEVLTGENIAVTPAGEAMLTALLRQYYRNMQSNAGDTPQAAGGDKFLTRLIEEAFRNYASDIHLEAYGERCRIRFRIDGKLIERYVIERDSYPALVNQIKIMANLDISEKRLPQDGRIFYQAEGGKFDLRVSSLPVIYGEKIVMRLLTRHVELLELSNLGFDERQLSDYMAAVKRPHGMILISGPTGSGKSTTLYATLRLLNGVTDNILTIEDPVEYTLEGVNQVQLKEEIGLTFGSTLRTFLRQDPDIIMVGEIRDGDTAQMAIRSSLTGHLILSTLHTNSAWGSVARLVDMGLHPYLISNTLVLCAAQRLLRLLCPSCKKEVSSHIEGVEKTYEAVGCEECYYTGYKGRKAIYEVIPIDDELTRAIRDSRSDISGLLKARGILTLRDSAMQLLRDGKTSPDEVLPLLR